MNPEFPMSALEHTADGEAILSIRDLNFFYGDFRGLKDVSLDIAKKWAQCCWSTVDEIWHL
jgi:hypothetical protein